MKRFTKNTLFFVIFSILVSLFTYGFLTDSFSRSNQIEKETRAIYRAITSEMDKMETNYEQISGRVSSGAFILAVTDDTAELDKARENRFINLFHKIGFSERDANLKYNSILLCKEHKGVIISERAPIKVDYQHYMNYCDKDNE